MTPIATVFIPFAAYHSQIVSRAFHSAVGQTVKCEVVIGLSPGTPATLRNEAMKAESDFVVFLDADDLLDPLFVERCLDVYDGKRYVYTAWSEGDAKFKPHDCPWSKDSHHIVTTLYPTAIFKALGGFDVTLPGHEDADFYMRSYSKGICGLYLDEVLVHRPDSGQRSLAFHADPNYQRIMEDIPKRNGGLDKIMGCCGLPDIQAEHDPGAQQPGDVLVETLWDGMHSEYSPFTDRLYVGGNRTKIYVSPIDVEKFPKLYKPVQDLNNLFPKPTRILKESGLL